MGNILIIGATSGIAKATAYTFASNKFNLILAGRDIEEINRIASDIRIRHSIKVDTEFFDALNYQNHKQFLDQCLDKAGEIEGVIIALGYLGRQTLAQSDFNESKHILDVNFTSCISILNIVANYLEKKKRGFICALSSVAGDRGRQSNYIYGAAKGGLAVFLQGLRNRLASSNVHVTTIKPGFVDTKMTYGQEGMFLVASPNKVAEGIFSAIMKNKNEVYLPFFWSWIMLIIKSIPENIFKKLKL